jgi:2'-5' RNA ligase
LPKTSYDGGVSDPLSNGAGRIDSFALVAYIPDPLARFLDNLRRELEPTNKSPRAHVTVLPPRPLSSDIPTALDQLSSQLAGMEAVSVVVGEPMLFASTNVVYLALREGLEEFQAVHKALNRDCVAYQEAYPFHPHVTLAQGLEPDKVQAALELACGRWAEYRGPREFPVESLVFVQATADCRWIDLAEFTLQPRVLTQ